MSANIAQYMIYMTMSAFQFQSDERDMRAIQTRSVKMNAILHDNYKQICRNPVI